MGRVLVLPQWEINDDDPVRTEVHEEAHNADNEDQDKDDSAFPQIQDNRNRNAMLAKITQSEHKMMVKQNRLLLKLLFEQQAEWKEVRSWVLTELDSNRATDRQEFPAIQSKMFKMVESRWYCGGTKEQDKFLNTFRSNFASHKHLFPKGDPNQVKYAVSSLDTWNNHPEEVFHSGPGFILKAYTKGSPARPGSEASLRASQPARDSKTLHRPA